MSQKIIVSATINNESRDFMADERDSLLEALRERIGLTGVKEGCNNGNCGACAVIMDGRLVNSCVVMAAEVQDTNITTVEGLAQNGELTPLQQSFLEEAALQCGICTPGFLLASTALLEHNPHPTEHEIRYWLAGNLCRCTGYDKIIKAVQKAVDLMPAYEHRIT